MAMATACPRQCGGVTTRYLVDDLNPTGYAQVVEELVGGAVQRTYTYGLQRINQSQLVNGTWTPSFYGYDGLGSVRALADATGAVTDTYDYDAWGNSVNTTGTTANVYRYRGEQYDADLNLYYLRARYFNPLTGRFLTRDPEEGDLQDPPSLHRYMYAADDPVNQADPTGMDYAYVPDQVGYFGIFVGPLYLGPTIQRSWADLWHFWSFWNPAPPTPSAPPAAPRLEYSRSPAENGAGLRLKVHSDCSRIGYRRIVYEVTGLNAGDWYVTEHVNPTSWAPPTGTSTDRVPGQFDDTIFGWDIGGGKQNFTISRLNPTQYPATPSIPIIVQLGGVDYGTLGIWHGGTSGMQVVQGNSTGWASCIRE